MITCVRVRDESIYVSPNPHDRLARYVVVFLRDGRPRRLTETFYTRKDANDAARSLRERVKAGVSVAA